MMKKFIHMILLVLFLGGGAVASFAARNFSVDDDTTTHLFVNGTTGNVGIGSVLPQAKLDVDGDIYVKGSVGIGSSRPAQKLDIVGNIRIPDSVSGGAVVDGVIYKGGIPFIHDFKPSRYNSDNEYDNTFIGLYAGNFTLGGTDVQGYGNTAVGYETLTHLTTGFANTALGMRTLHNVTTGGDNVALGAQALMSLTTGSLNVAIGTSALVNTTTGAANLALGDSAGFSIGTTSYNVFIGYNAGYYETGNYKLYIESSNSTTPLIYGDFAAANRVVNIYGNLGVGTAAPRGLLEVDATPYTSPFIVSYGLNVGVGTITPLAKLHVGNTGAPGSLVSATDNLYVAGDIEFDGKIYGDGSALTGLGLISGLTTNAVPRAASATSLVDSGIYVVAGNTGVGSIAPANKLDVDGNVYIKGNVGINSSRPSQQLDIVGNINLPDSVAGGVTADGVIYKGGIPFIHNFMPSNSTISYNTFVGLYAGNRTAQGGSSNHSGNRNVAVGYGAMTNLTTGYYNVAFGMNALNANTTGADNTALGAEALKRNLSGSLNVAIGTSALGSNVSGSYNTAVGESAGFSIVTTSSNVFLGYNAGYYETGSNKLYIESSNSTTPLIYGDFTAGNRLVTIYGNLGVGTYAPRGLLEVDASPYDSPFIVTFDRNVGIGSAVPQTKLDVDGTIYTHTSLSIGTAWPGATGQITIQNCFMFLDTDKLGWTSCNALNGVLTCSIDTDGICGSP